jgi:CheY-like chemotaxis protein
MTTPAPTSEAANPARKQYRVLYADDMQQLRELIGIVLSRDGHTVESAADGRLGLEKIATNPNAFDVVITDHHMPNCNGLQLVEGIRALPVPYQGKIIVFSSELSESVDLAYRRLKVDHILPKPIFPAQLRQLFAKL